MTDHPGGDQVGDGQNATDERPASPSVQPAAAAPAPPAAPAAPQAPATTAGTATAAGPATPVPPPAVPAAPVEDDPVTKQLKLDEQHAKTRQAIADADKATAEAQKATLVAQLPVSDTKPLEGKTEVGDKVGLVAELVAQTLLSVAAEGIATKVPKDARVLIVEDRRLVASDWTYQIVHQELGQQKQALDSGLSMVRAAAELPKQESPAEPETPAFLGALTAPQAIIGSAATLVGMFQTDYSITSRDVTTTGTPLVSAVAGALLVEKNASRHVLVDAFHLVDASPIFSDFGALTKQRSELERIKLELHTARIVAAAHRAADLRAELKAVAESRDKALADPKSTKSLLVKLEAREKELRENHAKVEAELPRARAAVTFAESLITRFDAFATAVLATPQGDGYPPLVVAALRERLHPGTGDPPVTHVLYLGSESAGAETVTRRSFFKPAGRMHYMGGVQVSFLLLETKTNMTTAAGTESLLGSMRYNLGAGTARPIARVMLAPPTPR